MTVVTRFAPSPTGFLHIGGARTALFNWLFAKHHGGRFLLRIEDTDRLRSTTEAVEAIFDGLRWLGLDWEGEPIMQFERSTRHADVAHHLLREGKAYYCYCSPDELQTMRDEAKAAGKPIRYNGYWRERPAADAPAGIPPVIRLKAPLTGETLINDQVQGDVRIANEQLDDMILLRADGTPTYMLSVVVDDHDMGITHVIRGDDHLTNAFRQVQLYRAMEWDVPIFAHIPLIHGPDGAKLSKRHGALGAEAYRDMGYLPEAMRNYLLRLGWGHGDDEIISTEQAIAWFDLDGVGRSPSRFDFVKLANLNGHYLRHADNRRLTDLTLSFIEKTLETPVSEEGRARLLAGMDGLKERARTLVELAHSALFYVRSRPLVPDDKAKKILTDPDTRILLSEMADGLEEIVSWDRHTLEGYVRTLAETRQEKLGKLAQPLRAALSGSTISPPVFEILEVLGREESLARIKNLH